MTTTDASMGSGRGDRNQVSKARADQLVRASLQWGPVVVTGISHAQYPVRWGIPASMGSGRGDRNQSLLYILFLIIDIASMGSGRGDRNQA